MVLHDQESVDRISKSVAKLMLKENHEVTLSSEEIAWTIFSLENGLAIFNFINGESVPMNLYGKALKICFQPLSDFLIEKLYFSISRLSVIH